MLSIVHASELQFRHDAATRDRELALLSSIREHEAARAALRIHAHEPALRPAAGQVLASVRGARERHAAWPRPIGAHGRLAGAAGAPCATC